MQVGETSSSSKTTLKRNLSPAEPSENGKKKSVAANEREITEPEVARCEKEFVFDSVMTNDSSTGVAVVISVKLSYCRIASSTAPDECDSEKENVHLIVIGHVDAGKSTLMGHLLYELGYVSKKLIQKYEHESEKIGKQSFVYAWVLDEIEEER